jgi:site-specific DNA-methyltransferase (adenine-specific)
MINVYNRDCLGMLKNVGKDETYDLIYLDPPFNTGHSQVKRTTQGRAGFSEKRYDVVELAKMEYNDKFEDYYGFLFPVLEELYRVLKQTGSILVHLDQNESHYAKIFLDQLFGRENFRNELIWTWDYGAKSKRYWPKKHSSIFWYTKSDEYYFDIQSSDRLPYMAPGLVTAEKLAQGKLPTDTWFISIVGTNSVERTNYPTQKPLKLIRRLVNCHSKEGDRLLDPFAGSGTFGVAAKELNRNCDLIDVNPEAVQIINERLSKLNYRELV